MKQKSSKVRRKKSRKTVKTKKYSGGSMEVIYPTFSVNNQTVSQNQASKMPKIQLYPIRYSTFIMYDPDAISGTYLHYMVVNIKNGILTSGDEIIPYAGPTPPPGSGTHRYIFEQYEQSSPFSIAAPERSKFDLSNFKKTHNLALKATKLFNVSV
jgi:phosphatidylethanolamine-binding protein (PEBP) family uncharacterized protein